MRLLRFQVHAPRLTRDTLGLDWVQLPGYISAGATHPTTYDLLHNRGTLSYEQLFLGCAACVKVADPKRLSAQRLTGKTIVSSGEDKPGAALP